MQLVRHYNRKFTAPTLVANKIQIMSPTQQPVFPPYGSVLNARDDYGAVGDGVTDDTDALQAAMFDAKRKHRTMFLPAGTYMISHPLVAPWYIHIVGQGPYGALTGWEQGTFIKATADFNVNWNQAFTPSAEWPQYDHIPPALLQTHTWAPDPTGDFSMELWPYNAAGHDFVDQLVIENVSFHGSSIAGLSGVAIDCAGEHTCLRNCCFKNCDAGIWFTGAITGTRLEQPSFWSCVDGIRITTNPWFWSFQRANPSGAGWKSAGKLPIFGMAGDGMINSWIYNTQATSVSVFGAKFENPYTTRTSVFKFDVDPTILGTNAGGQRGGSRSSMGMFSGYSYQNITEGPDTGDVGYAFVHISKGCSMFPGSTGSTDYREWPKPTVTIVDFQNYFATYLVDDTYQTWPLTTAVQRIIGTASADPVLQCNPFGFFFYSNDANERSFVDMMDPRINGYQITLPDGTHVTAY